MRKITLMMFLCFLALGVNAQVLKVSGAPSNGEWAENTTWYLIQNKIGGVVSTAAGYCNTEGQLGLHKSTKPENDDANALWCIVGSEANGYKFYNKASGTGKALYASRVLDSGSASFHMEADGDAVNFLFDIANSQKSGYIVIKDHNNQNNYWNKRGQNLAYWNSTGATNDDGSSFMFVDVADYEATIEAALGCIDKAAYVSTETVTPVDGLQNMLYSNAPCTNTQWGDQFEGHWERLFDNDPATIFHSEYGTKTSVDGLGHYIRVDMGEEKTIEAFIFSFRTRNTNCTVNSPTEIVVEGSNDADGDYEEIAVLTGLPTTNSTDYTSGVLTNGKAYRFIRYRVTKTSTNQKDGGGKVFFFISEFGMSEVKVVAECDGAYESALEELEKLGNKVGMGNNVASVLSMPAVQTEIKNAMHALAAKFAPLPVVGKFYNIRSASSHSARLYINTTALVYNAPDKAMCWANDYNKAEGNAVWTVEANGAAKNVHTGLYLSTAEAKESPVTATINAIGGDFVNEKYQYTIGANGMLHAQGVRNAIVGFDCKDDGQNNQDNASAWYIDEVESFGYTLSVSAAEWSTLVLGYNAVVPEGVTCYAVSAVNGSYATLTEVEGILPANTAVLVNAAQGNYTFTYTSEAAEATSMLGGTLYNKNVNHNGATVYVLSNVDGVVGLYPAAANEDGTVYNNANKAYLAGAQDAPYYSFSFDGTTGIEEVENTAAETVIYDLTGRRVQQVNKLGIYIVNGKQMLVK